MKEQAQALADARNKYQKLFTTHSDLWAKWADENDALIRGLTAAKSEMQAVESALRDAGLAHYKAHPESKKLPFGVSVRVTQSLVYDTATAQKWAFTHRSDLLTLDKKEFEKVAKVTPLAFVTLEEVPTITIPSDTDKLTEEE